MAIPLTPATDHEEEPGIEASLLMASGLALFWWLVVVLLIRPADLVAVWYEQKYVFTEVGSHVFNPYRLERFVNPPWAAVFLAPFALPPLEVAVLLQLCLYFCLLTLIIYKYGGNRTGVFLTLTSFMAMDNALELGIDWLPAIGLLMPPALSGVFLLVKPQIALGVGMTYTRRQILQGGVFMLIFLLVTLLIWGYWPDEMQSAVQRYTYDDQPTNPYNIAPSAVLPWPVSYLIGLTLGWTAFKRKDAALSILAWLFFVPYILFYSLLLHFAVLTVRLPLLAKIIYGALWLIYGGGALYVWLLR